VAERPIVVYGDPVLREKSRIVEKFDRELKDLVSDMTDTLHKAKGLGLAAVQVGVLLRVFLVDLSAVEVTEKLRVFVNPEIVDTEGEIEYEEGCLSFPGIYQKITRASKVTVKAFDENGEPFEITINGLAARAILHEFDHLEGKLFIDYLTPFAKTLLTGKLKKLVQA
jgi:peptide deformylase